MSGQMDVQVKVYESTDDYNKDARKMIGAGWEVASTTDRQPRSGCIRNVFLLGLFRPHKPETVVTYRRPKP